MLNRALVESTLAVSKPFKSRNIRFDASATILKNWSCHGLSY